MKNVSGARNESENADGPLPQKPLDKNRQVGVHSVMKKPGARERILETAAELFTERGYGSVGINEIIEESETANAGFYHHFPSKENLCITWLMENHARSDARHDAIPSSPGKAEDKIYEYFEGLKVWMKEKDFRGCPYTNTTASLDRESPPIARQVELHKLSIRDFFYRSGTRDRARGFACPEARHSLFSNLFGSND